MALQSLKSQLKQLVQSMYDEGLLDRQFEAVQSLQNADNPQIVVELMTIFCDGTPKVLSELTNNLNGYVVDYNKMSYYVHHLKGSSCSIGARQLTHAVLDLRQSCNNNNKEGCQQALLRVKHEFYRLHTKLMFIAQLEKKIYAYEIKQQ